MFGIRRLRGYGRNGRVWLVLGLGFALGLFGFVPRADIDVDIRWSIPILSSSDPYLPDARTDSGEELVFILVGSSQCHWSNRPELRKLVRQAKLAIRDGARSRGLGFAAVGVARDVIASKGIEHLATFGDFDEIMAGRGWFNIGVMRYIFHDLPGPAATPQILIVERTVEIRGKQRLILDERVLTRRVGLVEIREWVESGMVLPATQ